MYATNITVSIQQRIKKQKIMPQIQLPAYKQPILLFEQIEIKNKSQVMNRSALHDQSSFISNHSRLESSYIQYDNVKMFLITTLDGFVFKLQLLSNNQYRVLVKIQVEAPCTAIFDWDYQQTKQSKITHKKHLLLGLSTGQLQIFAQRSQKKLYSYKVDEKQRAQIIRVYARQKQIFIWTINSCIQIVQVNEALKKIQKKNRIKLQYDICSIIVINNQLLRDYTPCVAFKNLHPSYTITHHQGEIQQQIQVIASNGLPILFDCSFGAQILKVLDKAAQDREDVLMENEEFELMVYNREEKRIVTSSWVRDSDEFVITVFDMQMQQRMLLLPRMRIKIQKRPMHLDSRNKYLFISRQEYCQLLDIKQRRPFFKIKNQNHIWCFILHAKQNIISQDKVQLQYKFMTAKGFNVYQPNKSKRQSVTLHIGQGSHQFAAIEDNASKQLIDQ